jgi:hypothetical protein
MQILGIMYNTQEGQAKCEMFAASINRVGKNSGHT